MPIATELKVNTSASALDMANAIFGNGVTVTSATYTGAATASGTYTGGLATLGELTQSDTGVILSTGNATDFTNSSGTTDTNILNGTSTDHTGVGEVDGDPGLDAVSGMATEDGAFLDATFVAAGDLLTMQFVFSSEEYLEFVNSGVNDAFAVWVNGDLVPLMPADGSTQNVSIDTINNTSASNLYLDNPTAADTYNTEMDGATVVLSLTAPVNAGASNTIRIGIGDGGDSDLDSNVLIMGNSVQTVSIADSDQLIQAPSTKQVHDLLSNDINTSGNPLTITHLNNIAVNVGDDVTLPSGEQILLNADMTVTIVTDADLGTTNFTYSTVDSAGNTATGYATLETTTTPPDFIVEGTAGDDLIDASYTGDPEGDLIDNTGHSDASNSDSVVAGAGNDTVLSGAGDDTIDGGIGADSIDGGLDADTILGGAGNDTLDGGTGFTAIKFVDVANGQTVTGSSNTNYFRWAAEPASNARIMLDAGLDGDRTGDGVADYIVVATTNDTNTLAIRSFDYGLDKIVLQEPYVGVSSSVTPRVDNEYSAVFTVTYASGNTQSFNIEGEGVAPTAANVFTTTAPTNETGADDYITGGDGDDLILGKTVRTRFPATAARTKSLAAMAMTRCRVVKAMTPFLGAMAMTPYWGTVSGMTRRFMHPVGLQPPI